MEKVLVANRGEIAVRVIRACHELGLAAVAVYSEPDRLAPHVLAADEAVAIGPAPARESYLDVHRILDAARLTGTDAIHPGYGFLAESADFARRVEGAGLIFVGPPASAIEAMGDKTAARARMREAGVPVVPGSDVVEDAREAERAAEAVGWPVMLKAAAGGGGKGMRIATGPEELRAALPRARREAEQAFGDGRVYLERYLERPRHIEIQLLGEPDGSVWHLGERECSIQRRHQKLVEEAPSPALDPETRGRMGEVAVAAAEAVDYRGAGTVEFLYQDGDFYFLEMNTRIQVEHPVTELVTGVDLVRAQLRIAAGLPRDEEPHSDWPLGHAIECRIGAEDPRNAFFPSAGRIGLLRAPAGPGVRWDAGVSEGLEVGLHYDPLLAKLIVHDRNRKAAIARMRRALRELRLSGLATTQPFHLALMDEADFRAGRLTVRYVEEHPGLLSRDAEPEWWDAAVAAAVLLEEEAARHRIMAGVDGGSRATGGEGLSTWRRAFAPGWPEP